jgi:hypothetical protein
VTVLAFGTLRANLFRDSTREFFDGLVAVLNQAIDGVDAGLSDRSIYESLAAPAASR